MGPVGLVGPVGPEVCGGGDLLQLEQSEAPASADVLTAAANSHAEEVIDFNNMLGNCRREAMMRCVELD